MKAIVNNAFSKWSRMHVVRSLLFISVVFDLTATLLNVPSGVQVGYSMHWIMASLSFVMLMISTRYKAYRSAALVALVFAARGIAHIVCFHNQSMIEMALTFWQIIGWLIVSMGLYKYLSRQIELI